MRKKDGLIPVKGFIKDLFSKYYMDGTKQVIMREWEESLGENAKHTQIVSLRHGQLLVRVDHPTFLQELTFRRRHLKERLNNRIGREVIKNISFRGGLYLE